MTLGEKLRRARLSKNLSQIEFAQQVGITERSIYNYEQMETSPQPHILKRLAEALGVTVAYLMDEEETDTQKNLAHERFIAQARSEYGSKGAKDAQRIINEAAALFAGGELNEAGKDLFFQSLTEVYFESKAEAREKFTPKSRKSRKA